MEDDPPKSTDVVFLQGPTEDGAGMRILRARDDRVEAGEVRPLVEGKPLGSGEIVKLAPRAETPRLCDVEVIAKLDEVKRTGPGPAQVATNAYRASWDRVFGGAKEDAGVN